MVSYMGEFLYAVGIVKFPVVSQWRELCVYVFRGLNHLLDGLFPNSAPPPVNALSLLQFDCVISSLCEILTEKNTKEV